ncbi:hypothetical protein Scep_028355 [Stephania cephalantha]|uniref:polynucleotide adenylyltransferase n=1 Tax=Stephania cephalantha TaxID=152367 RepID=A0AAP0EH58_9MAGN
MRNRAIVNSSAFVGETLSSKKFNHWLYKKTQSKESYVALKLDMSKAYDRVEGYFLEQGEGSNLSIFVLTLCGRSFINKFLARGSGQNPWNPRLLRNASIITSRQHSSSVYKRGTSSYGVVIRDTNGDFVAAMVLSWCPSSSSSSPSAVPDYLSLSLAAAEAPDPSPAFQTPVHPAERPLERGWFRPNARFKSPMLQLHKEIIDFCEFLSPTPEEQGARSAAVRSVFDVIKHIWPACQVEVFGSFKTGLYLPTSDIDVVILDSRVNTPQIGLYALSRALSQKGVAKNIQVIGKARVPIIKFVEKKSGVAFDISFDVENGPKAADFIKDAVKRLPPLRPLCLILKIFLQQRALNEVYSGGIGSYALLTMLIVQLQMHWKGQQLHSRQVSPEHNLGVLLVNFFDFYGHKLNIYDVGVSCNGEGGFFLKANRGFLNRDRPYLLSIEDPQAPENDIGKNSFNYSQIRSAFGMAFSMLTNSTTILNLGPDKSILGTIIRPDPVLLERKGGSNGKMTFNSLLPGAGNLPLPQFDNNQDLYCNWMLDEEEPLPRGNGISGVGEPRSSSSQKRKRVLKEKLKSQIDENGQEGRSSHEKSMSRKQKRLNTSEKSRRHTRRFDAKVYDDEISGL